MTFDPLETVSLSKLVFCPLKTCQSSLTLPILLLCLTHAQMMLLATLLFATAALAQIIIDTPSSLIQCGTTTLTWSGGNGMSIM